MIPVDEMLYELRGVLLAFDDNPTHDGFGDIQKEMRRIEHACEDALEEYPDG